MRYACYARRGITRTEALVVTIGIVLLCVIGWVLYLFIWDTRRFTVYTARDSTQLQQIHKGLIIFSQMFDGTLPKPSMIWQTTDDGNLENGDESLNTTAHLYSMTIAQHYFTPQLLISPTEPNPLVTVQQNYNHDAYSPGNNVFWDPRFAADLQTGSNVSYAHMPLVGQIADAHWRDTLDSNWVHLANRGPKGGAKLPGSYTTDQKGDWLGGNVVFADSHVEWWDVIHTYSYVDDTGQQRQGNIYEDHPQDARGNTVSFTKSIEDGQPVFQWD